jgi:hypothetical protein
LSPARTERMPTAIASNATIITAIHTNFISHLFFSPSPRRYVWYWDV